MKRPDIELLQKKSRGKPITLKYYKEERAPESLSTSLKIEQAIVKNHHDIKMIETKKGFAGWVLN